jgi:dTDP-4-dehydrorhamnose reductase
VLRQEESVKQRFLIIGAESLIGSSLRHYWRQAGHDVAGTYLECADPSADHLRLDLRQPPTAWPGLPSCDATIICSGITSLETCRRDPAASQLINVTRILDLIRCLHGRTGLLLFLSSNLVFDGSRPHRNANDPVCPRTEYGRQKAAVESGLSSQDVPWTVVRLTKVMHPRFALLQQWGSSLQAGHSIQPFSDFVCAPIPLNLVINGLARVAAEKRTGIWQFSATNDIAYSDMARHMAAALKLDSRLLQPTESRRVLDSEHVPQHTTLDTTRAVQELGLEMPSAEEALSDTYAGLSSEPSR